VVKLVHHVRGEIDTMPRPEETVDLRPVTARELVLTQLERANEYNRGFADCYLALASRGLFLPGLVQQHSTGFRTLRLEEPA
jgi:hypothetical protein